MPKMKTNSGAKKRFRSGGKGKVKRSKAFANHILTKKSPSRKRRLRQGIEVDKSNMENIKKLLPYGAR